MEVVVLGHRGYLGSTVARLFAEKGARVLTTDLRFGDEMLEFATGHLIVNCIRSDDPEIPRELAAVGRLIHPSTDAIREDTAYARAKREGDTAQAVIIRAGIIDTRHNLAVGYTNWLCNPVTPLEWARYAWSLREAKPLITHYGRETINRYEVAKAVAYVFGTTVPVPRRAKEPNNRVVASWARLPPLRDALKEYRAWLSHS